LTRLINSILQSNYPQDKLEIIVVDDASTDGTYEEIRAKFHGVKIIRNEKEALPATSRNIGIKKLMGNISS
jgi:glycosyltransferase involved in cell wall biosynthesis